MPVVDRERPRKAQRQHNARMIAAIELSQYELRGCLKVAVIQTIAQVWEHSQKNMIGKTN